MPCNVQLVGPIEQGNTTQGYTASWSIQPWPVPSPSGNCQVTFFLDGHAISAAGGSYGQGDDWKVTGKGDNFIAVGPPLPKTPINFRVTVNCEECRWYTSSTMQPPGAPPATILEKVMIVFLGVPLGIGLLISGIAFWIFFFPFALSLWPFGRYSPGKWWEEGQDLLGKWWKELSGLLGRL